MGWFSLPIKVSMHTTIMRKLNCCIGLKQLWHGLGSIFIVPVIIKTSSEMNLSWFGFLVWLEVTVS